MAITPTNALRLRRLQLPSFEDATQTAGAEHTILAVETEETTMTTIFNVKEMTCGNCAKHVTKTLHSLKPCAQVKVDLKTRKVEVSSRPRIQRRSPKLLLRWAIRRMRVMSFPRQCCGKMV